MTSIRDDKEPTEGSPEIILLPDIPESVVRVWEKYESRSGINAEQEQRESAEVVVRLRDFAGETQLISSVYRATYLIRLFEKLSASEPQASYAKEAIESYEGEVAVDAVESDKLQPIEKSLHAEGFDKGTIGEATNALAIVLEAIRPGGLEVVEESLRDKGFSEDEVTTTIESFATVLKATKADDDLKKVEEILKTLGLSEDVISKTINALHDFAIESDKKYISRMARDTLEIGRTLRKKQHKHTANREAKQLSGQIVGSPWAIPTGEDDEVSIKQIATLTSDISDAFAKNPKGVNIESMTVNAISAYIKLEDLDSIDESEALKIVYAIDNLYQPFIALMRWDGLESGLKEQMKAARVLYGQGLEGVITPEELAEARKKKKAAGLHDINIILAMVPKVIKDVFLGNSAIVKSSIYDMSDHGIKTGTAKVFPGEVEEFLELEEFKEGSSLSTKWRAKGDYSTAESIHKDPNDHVADLFGMLIKVPTYEVAADMIVTAYKSLGIFDNMQGMPSVSRDAFIVLQGNDMPPRVLAILTKELGDLGPNIETKTKSNGYQAAKITFIYTYKYKDIEYKTPIEVMFQTPKDRQVATVGSAAHLRKVPHLPKDDEDKYREPHDEELDFQGQVTARKDKMGKPGLTEISGRGADLYFQSNNTHRVKTKRIIKDIGRSSLT